MILSTRCKALALLLLMLSACTPTFKPMGPAITQARIENDTFIARDGVELPLSVWGPRQNPEKIVVAAHSFGEFRDAFALIGEHLADRNIAVWAYDQRGFGDAPHRGIWAGKDTLITDFGDFTRAVRSASGERAPIIFIGESMGAAVVIGAMANEGFEQPSAVILSGPGVREHRPYRYWFNVGLWLATRFAASYEVDVPRTYDQRYADYHAKRWVEDPKIIEKVRLDTYYGLIRLSDYASDAASQINTPTLILFGTDDGQIHPNSICALNRRVDSAGTLKVFKGGPHLMFQVRQQSEVLELIDEWIDAPGVRPDDETRYFCGSG